MQTLINIVVFILILGIVVLIHELGHLLRLNRLGFIVVNFQIGGTKDIFAQKR